MDVAIGKACGGGITYHHNYVISHIGCAFFAPATYCFIFVSGFYGMRYKLEKHIAMEIWCILAALCSFILSATVFSNMKLMSLPKLFFPIATSKWWFMTNYMYLFLASPLLNKGIEYISNYAFKGILFLLLAYNTLTMFAFIPNAGSNFIGFLTIFLLGRYCKIYNVNISLKKSAIGFSGAFACLVTMMTLSYLYLPHGGKAVIILLGYNTPLMTAMSVTAFYIVYNIKPNYSESINKLLKPVLFIYLLTEGIGKPLYKYIIYKASGSYVNLFFTIAFTVVLCLLIGHIILYVSSHYLQSPVVKITRRFLCKMESHQSIHLKS